MITSSKRKALYLLRYKAFLFFLLFFVIIPSQPSPTQGTKTHCPENRSPPGQKPKSKKSPGDSQAASGQTQAIDPGRSFPWRPDRRLAQEEPRRRARFSPARTYPGGAPQKVGESRTGQDEGQRQAAEKRQVEIQVQKT